MHLKAQVSAAFEAQVTQVVIFGPSPPHLLLHAGFAVLSRPSQVPRFVLGLGTMLNAFFLMLVLCVLEFALLEWLFRPTPSERNEPSDHSSEKKVRAARAGGQDS